MKTAIFAMMLLAVSISMTSCKKEEIRPNKTTTEFQKKSCCGEHGTLPVKPPKLSGGN